ncbi:MAG: hypothetical protein IID32_00250 [Planctomycetes bacterium]|nr:hypothetical protein [Planctomycetota bacterium]
MTKQQIRQRLLNDLADVDLSIDGAEKLVDRQVLLACIWIKIYEREGEGPNAFEWIYRSAIESLIGDIKDAQIITK